MGVPTLLYAEVKTAPDQPVGVLQASAQFPSLQRGAPTADLGLVSGLGKVRVGQSELAALPRASLGVSASTSGAARGRLHDPGGACMTPEGCASQSAWSHAAPRGPPETLQAKAEERRWPHGQLAGRSDKGALAAEQHPPAHPQGRRWLSVSWEMGPSAVGGQDLVWDGVRLSLRPQGASWWETGQSASSTSV